MAISLTKNAGDTLFDVEEGEINLSIGAPDERLLLIAVDRIKAATIDALSEPKGSMIQYGPTNGDSKFLEEVKQLILRHSYKGRTREIGINELYLTCGATYGLSLVLTVFGASRNSNLAVYVPDPIYFIALDIFKDFGLSIIPIKTDDEGIEIEDLKQKLMTRNDEKKEEKDVGVDVSRKFKSFIYLVPTFANPTGGTLSITRRKELIKLGYEYSSLIICDDVYEMLPFTNDPLPPPLVEMDLEGKTSSGCVISNCTFSKIYGPGSRLGWIQAHPSLIQDIANSGIALSGGASNQLTSIIFRSALKLGYIDEMMALYKKTYSSRLDTICKVIEEEMPKSVRFIKPKGGFFLWLTLPENIKAVELLEICKKEKIKFQPGNWSSPTSSFQNCMRIAFSFYDEQQLSLAMKRIAFHLNVLMNK